MAKPHALLIGTIFSACSSLQMIINFDLQREKNWSFSCPSMNCVKTTKIGTSKPLMKLSLKLRKYEIWLNIKKTANGVSKCQKHTESQLFNTVSGYKCGFSFSSICYLPTHSTCKGIQLFSEWVLLVMMCDLPFWANHHNAVLGFDKFGQLSFAIFFKYKLFRKQLWTIRNEYIVKSYRTTLTKYRDGKNIAK